MKQYTRIIAIVLVLTISFWLGFYQITPPDVTPESKNPNDFSIQRVRGHLQVITKAPHPVESQANAEVRDYIVRYLTGLGLKVELQPGTMEAEGYTYRLVNIFTQLSGREPNGLNILFSAHYDSAPQAPGAADDGAGLGALLETVRVLQMNPRQKNNIYLLITDGEEPGLLGAKSFVQSQRNLLQKIDFAINFEARGNKGPVVMFESSEPNLGIIKAYRKIVPFPLGFSFSQDVYKVMPNYTDFTVLKEAKLKGMNFAMIDGFASYHTPNDNLEKLDPKSLHQYGRIALHMANYLANISQPEFKELERAENAVYFPFLKGNLIYYSQNRVIPEMIIVLLVFLLGLFIGFRKKLLHIKKILMGSLLGLGSLLLTSMISIIFVKLLVSFYHLKMRGFTIKSFPYSGFYTVLISILFLGLIFAIYRMVSKKVSPFDMIYGGMFIWVILLVPVSIGFKGASYLLIWPLLATNVALVYLMNRGIKIREYERLILLAFATFVNIMIFGPVIYMFYIAMTIGAMPILSFLLGLPVIPLMLLFRLVSNNSPQNDDFSGVHLESTAK